MFHRCQILLLTSNNQRNWALVERDLCRSPVWSAESRTTTNTKSLCQPWLFLAALWKHPRMELPSPLWVTCCRTAPTPWWKSLSLCPTWMSQTVNTAVGPYYISSHHSITSVTHFQVSCRLLLHPFSPKCTTSAHTAPTLWSIAQEKMLVSTKMGSQIFFHVRLEISDYWVRYYWTFTLPLTLWHKLVTTSWHFIIVPLQLRAFKSTETLNIHLWACVLRESWQFMTKMALLSQDQVTKCRRRKMIMLHTHTRTHAARHMLHANSLCNNWGSEQWNAPRFSHVHWWILEGLWQKLVLRRY